MRVRLRPGVARYLAGLVLALCFLPVAPEAATPAVDAVAADQTFTDPTGDSKGRLDVMTVQVSSSGDRLDIRVRTREQTVNSNEHIFVDIDANVDGTRDYGFYFRGGGAGALFWVRYPGNLVAAPSTVGTTSGQDFGITFNLRLSAIGNPTRIRFAVAVKEAPLRDVWDWAPDTGRWDFVISGAPPPPPPPPPPANSNQVAITSLSRSPQSPVAGQPFTITADVARVGRAGRWAGTFSCSGSIAGRRIQSFGSVPSAGRAACRWDVPVSAQGKRMVATITVQEGGPPASRTVRMRIAGPRTTLSAGGARTAPAQPEAGRLFYYALSVFARSGRSESRIRTGTVSCRATIAGRAVPVSEHQVLAREGIRCAWRIPSSAAGKRMNGTIVVRSQGATLTHRFVRRVRG